MSKELSSRSKKIYFRCLIHCSNIICWKTELVEDWREFLRREFLRATQLPVLVPRVTRGLLTDPQSFTESPQLFNSIAFGVRGARDLCSQTRLPTFRKPS